MSSFHHLLPTCVISLHLLLFSPLVCAGIENIDLNYTAPIQTYEELYKAAIDAYVDEQWENAVTLIEGALADFRLEQDVEAKCWSKCQTETKDNKLLNEQDFDGQLRFLHYSLRIRQCWSACKHSHLGARGVVKSSVKKLFQHKDPYSYLQFAYFKLDNIQKAAEAAVTYMSEPRNAKNKENEYIQRNIELYAKAMGINETEIISREALPHTISFKLGQLAYQDKDYKSCISHFEDGLDKVFKAFDKCTSLCENQHEQRQSSMRVALFSHYQAIIECRSECRQSISIMDGKLSPKIIPYHYHYLQFCYYQVGKVGKAAMAAQTYLLFIPSDEIMKENMEFYREKINSKTILARQRGKRYLAQFALEDQLLEMVQVYTTDTDSTIKGKANKNVDEIFDKVNESIDSMSQTNAHEEKKKKKNKGKKTISPVKQQQRQRTGDVGEDMDFKESLDRIRDPTRWKKNSNINMAQLLMEARQLNGSERVLFDNVIDGEECVKLMKLVRALAKGGDGYAHYKNAESPFTDKETFKGVTIDKAAEAAEKYTVDYDSVKLYQSSAEKVRELTEAYFDMPTTLYFSYTHLVCRHSLESEIKDDEEFLSHPIHSDNCIVNGDGPGTCPKRAPAFTERDYSAVLYLNEEFQGGEFIFANKEFEEEARVQPKCGRLVAFSSQNGSNLHGVLGVRKGFRCALPLWFTLNERRQERAQLLAAKFLDRTKKGLNLFNQHKENIQAEKEKLRREEQENGPVKPKDDPQTNAESSTSSHNKAPTSPADSSIPPDPLKKQTHASRYGEHMGEL